MSRRSPISPPFFFFLCRVSLLYLPFQIRSVCLKQSVHRSVLIPHTSDFHAGLFALHVPRQSVLVVAVVAVCGVDFEEVVQHDQQHGGAAEEERKRVELGVCYHCFCFLVVVEWTV